MGIKIRNTIKKSLDKVIKRALHTVAQTAIGIIGTSVYLGDVNWNLLISACVLSGISSILKSITIGMPEE